MQPDDGCDLAQSQLLAVVEAKDRALDLRYAVDSRRQDALQFRPFQKHGRKTAGAVREVVQHVLPGRTRGVLEAGHVQSTDFHQPFVVTLWCSCSAWAIAASIRFALRRFCRGAQSSPRRLSRMAPRILYSA